jgi:hypothetical protein
MVQADLGKKQDPISKITRTKRVRGPRTLEGKGKGSGQEESRGGMWTVGAGGKARAGAVTLCGDRFLASLPCCHSSQKGPTAPTLQTTPM